MVPHFQSELQTSRGGLTGQPLGRCPGRHRIEHPFRRPTMPELLTTNEVAEIIRTPADTLRYWRFLGKGPRSVKLGRRVLYARTDVEAWIEAQRAGQTA